MYEFIISEFKEHSNVIVSSCCRTELWIYHVTSFVCGKNKFNYISANAGINQSDCLYANTLAQMLANHVHATPEEQCDWLLSAPSFKHAVRQASTLTPCMNAVLRQTHNRKCALSAKGVSVKVQHCAL